MARTFTKNAANFMDLGANSIGSLIHGASAISIAAQVNPASFDTGFATNRILHWLLDSGTGCFFCTGGDTGTVGAPNVSMRSQATDAAQQLAGSGFGSITADGNWKIVGVVSDFANDSQSLYIGGSKIRETPLSNFGSTTYVQGDAGTAIDRIGGQTGVSQNTSNQFDGGIEYVAVWNSDILASGFGLLASGTHPLDVASGNLVFLMVLGYETPDVCLAGSGVQSTINGSLPFVDGPTGLPTTANDDRFVLGVLSTAGILSNTVVTEDPDFSTSIAEHDETGGPSGMIHVGHKVIDAPSTLSYAPTLDTARTWVAGIAAYKADVAGGGSTPAPTITSPLEAEVTVGVQFDYSITATNNPLSYNITNAPAGWSVDANGEIHETPTEAGTFEIGLSATNETGTGPVATLVLTIHPELPAPPPGVYRHKPLPVSIVTTLGNIYHGSGSKF